MESTDDSSPFGPKTNAELREVAIDRMIQTAIRLIAKNGASKLSLVDVGRESGYSHSLPNYYFKSKDRLLKEVFSFIVVRFKKKVTTWARENSKHRIRPGLSNLDASIRAFLAMQSMDQESSRAMYVLRAESFSAMPGLLEDVRTETTETLKFIEEQISIGINRGEIDAGIDAKSLALVILSTVRGAASQYLIDPENVDPHAIADTLIKALLGGIRNRAKPEMPINTPNCANEPASPPFHPVRAANTTLSSPGE